MIIETQQLSFSYQTTPVLKDISLRAESHLNVLIGPNAAGKSTLINCLAGLLNPRGNILINNKKIQQWDKQTLVDSVAYVPQDNNTRSLLTVFETVLLGRLSRLSLLVDNEDLEIVHNMLKALKLDHLASEPIGTLSGGQRQMISIAQALVKEPRILLMDEPTNNLDLARQLEMFSLIKHLTEERELTTVMALHDLNLASRFANKLFVLKHGQLYSSGTPHEVISESMLEKVYGIEANIVHDENCIPQIFPIKAISILKETGHLLHA